MKFIKQRWLWITVATSIALALIAFVIRQPKKPVSDLSSADVPNPATVEQSVQKSPPVTEPANSTSTAESKAPHTNLPVPAQKLHKVLRDPEFKVEPNASLDQRIEKLNSQIAEIDEQLSAYGAPVPQQPTDAENTVTSSSAERLQAIKAHMENREQN